jgi:hypothetical protein
MQKRKAIELYNDKDFIITEESDGTHIKGMLAYPGISSNGKFYSIEQLLAGHNKDLPMWLNHATTIGIEGIGDDLLPPSYRSRLQNGEEIIVGREHLTFDADKLQLTYEGIVTDSFYRNPEILKQMSVSQGVLHDRDLKQTCDAVSCWKAITGSVYQEMSLVFRPGFSIATLSIEAGTIENENTYNLSNLLKRYMSDDKSQSKEAEKPCGCKDGEAAGQAAGIMSQAGNCPPGKVYDQQNNTCVDAPESGNAATNAGSKGVTSVPGEENAITKAEASVKKAQEQAEKSSNDLKIATEALLKAGKEAEEMTDEEKQKMKDKEKKADEASARMEGSHPNADDRSRAKAQKEYNDKLKIHYDTLKSVEASNTAYVKSVMTLAKEAATKTASLTANTQLTEKRKSIEAQTLGVKAWMDLHCKGDENVSNDKRWKIDENFTDQFVQKKFKSLEGALLFDKYIPYKEHMKSIEADDVSMAGGTDPNNFQRTMSELVLVYPDGDIITPIQQFCETAILAPGKKQHLFYDTNKATFGPTDEANLDAGGSGYALVPSELTINASGGSLSPIGALTRIGFTKLEEIPIDVVQKVNIGFAMEAENQKNLEVLTTCYDDDTAYDPTTDAIKPKGGGDKGAVDSKGNTHWVNGNTGTHLTSTDSGATTFATVTGLFEVKKTLLQTGLNVSNAKLYLDPAGIIQLTNPAKNTGISSYLQRSVPEVITEGYIEKLVGIDLIASSQTAVGDVADIRRGVAFLPIVSFGFVTGRETQIDAERVARQQSFFLSASLKAGAFCKKIESTVRFSFDITE